MQDVEGPDVHPIIQMYEFLKGYYKIGWREFWYETPWPIIVGLMEILAKNAEKGRFYGVEEKMMYRTLLRSRGIDA